MLYGYDETKMRSSARKFRIDRSDATAKDKWTEDISNYNFLFVAVKCVKLDKSCKLQPDRQTDSQAISQLVGQFTELIMASLVFVRIVK